MSAKYTTQFGEVFVSDDVLATIAGIATTECYGLVGMAKKDAFDSLSELLKRDSLVKGVKVHTENDEIIIDLHIIVEFGTNISTVAENIVSKVKYTVESMTGLKVKKININVQGVRI